MMTKVEATAAAQKIVDLLSRAINEMARSEIVYECANERDGKLVVGYIPEAGRFLFASVNLDGTAFYHCLSANQSDELITAMQNAFFGENAVRIKEDGTPVNFATILVALRAAKSQLEILDGRTYTTALLELAIFECEKSAGYL